MISCRKATELTEKKLAGELNWKERAQLMMHRFMCAACRRYGRQSRKIDQLLRRKTDRVSEESSNTFSAEELEKKIREKLKER